jgi:tricarballylate dehydrogenase
MTTDNNDVSGPWDLVVVGHGAAGLSAALAYLETAGAEHRRVAVLDKAPRAQRGGSTAWTSAVLRLDDDLQLAEDWGRIVRETGGSEANEAYIENFYENVTDTLNWIRRNGVGVTIMRNAAPPGAPSRNGHAVTGGGRAIVDTFADLVTAKGGECFYETELIALEREAGGPISGVRVRSVDGAEHLMRTTQVVLATGGFEGDREEVGRRIPGGETIDTVSVGTRVNTGGGIAAAVAVGAAKAGQYDGSHLEPVDPRADVTEPLIMSWQWGILVDPEGKRFMDEVAQPIDRQFDFVAKEVLARGGRAYAIADAGIKARSPLYSMVNNTPLAPIRADSLEELADALGVDRAGLVATVAEYNAACSDDPFDPMTIDGKHTVGLTPPKSYWAQPLTEAPFEAFPVGVQICFTFEGLKVDGTTHVLDQDGAVIPGLRAAGEIVGTFYGNTYPAGTSVLRSLTFGRLAGLEAAQSRNGALL